MSETQPIKESFMDNGELFGLEFRDGFVFFEVTGTEFLQFKPYTGIGNVAAGSNSGWSQLTDDGTSSGDDIIHLDTDSAKILHCAIGQTPDVIRRYTNYPEGQNRLRSIPNLDVPSPGDDYGYINGVGSPFDGPTGLQELVIPPGVHLDFNFHNPDNQDHNVVLGIEAAEYNVRALDVKNGADKNAIRRIVSPGSPMPIYPAGSLDNQVRYQLKSNFGVDEIPYSRVQQVRGGN